jgi:hypothetical protein
VIVSDTSGGRSGGGVVARGVTVGVLTGKDRERAIDLVMWGGGGKVDVVRRTFGGGAKSATASVLPRPTPISICHASHHLAVISSAISSSRGLFANMAMSSA